MKDIVSDPQGVVIFAKVAAWLIGLLLSIISALMGFLLWYILKIFKGTGDLNGKISKNTYTILDLKEQQTSNLSALHSSEKSIWDELIKLRRALVSGTMVLQRRREETNQILDDQRRAESEMAKHKKILQGHHKLLKRHRGRLDLTETKVIDLSDEIMLLKNKGGNDGKP